MGTKPWGIGPCVYFGSARTKPEDKYYQLAERITRSVRRATVTGGGPGIMEAGNKGRT
jgi:predicted Rossmann-fold nucleotide-binding protein